MSVEWLAAGLTAYKHREDIRGIFRKGHDYLFGPGTSIAVTGMYGVGKSVLADYLTGKALQDGYKLPQQSQAVERSTASKDGQKLGLCVIPGQHGASYRLKSLDEIFTGKKPVHGVVHVVANGFASTRLESARESLVKNFGYNTLPKYRAHMRELELQDLQVTCEMICASQRKHGRLPSWMLIAVDKIDLYQNEAAKARQYYAPEWDSEFTTHLRELVRRLGSDFIQITAVPVCACLEKFAWNKKVVDPQIDEHARKGYLAQFYDQLLAQRH